MLVVGAINKLSNEKRISLLRGSRPKQGGAQVAYMLYQRDVAEKLRKLDTDSIAVYNHVIAQGSKGTWSAEVRKELSYIQQPNITRILSTLASEEYRLLKVVQSVNNRTKKVYIGINVQPSKEITGGPWYTDAKFDKDFVADLEDFLKGPKSGMVNGACASVRALQEKLQLVITDESLDVGETRHLLDSMVYGGDLEVVPPAILRKRGRVVVPATDDRVYTKVARCGTNGSSSGGSSSAGTKHEARGGEGGGGGHVNAFYMDMQHFTSVPCGLCPLMRECRVGGIVSPLTCKYMDDWAATQF